MEVFKFGGASTKDAKGVINVSEIIKTERKGPLFVVISAMGKTTNALEEIVNFHFSNEKEKAFTKLEEIKQYHLGIIRELFSESKHAVYDKLNNFLVEIEWAIEDSPAGSFDFEYDQIVSMGELISSTIVSEYLNSQGISNIWIDARDFIKTNERYREGRVQWEKTEKELKNLLSKKEATLFITQGFIGATQDNNTTTLGREGSDFTAAIIAHILGAESVSIWKDVAGVLNADPKYFSSTVKLNNVSYEQAIELSYYGASVIHPRTIQPLKNKQIPLYVKSFIAPKESGTVINNNADGGFLIPCFIFKVNQVMVSLSPRDFSFIAEDNLKEIFTIFTKHSIKINLMQNSAITFWACFDYEDRKFEALQDDLQVLFEVSVSKNLELLTITNYNDATVEKLTSGKKIMLEQKSKNTIRLVLEPK